MEHKKKKQKSKKELLAEIDNLKKQLIEKENQYLYLQADFENYKKNAEREKEIFVKFAKEDLIKKLLPVLDEYESAFKSNEGDIEGFKIIYKNLYKILEGEGLKPIESVGEKFDHNYHEAVMQGVSEKEGTILEEFQKGYMLHDRVIRHAKVKVAKNE